MNVPIILPRVSPQPYTRLAFEGALFARDQGKAEAYNHRMFTAFFQDELDIGAASVLAECAGEVGLNKQDFRAALDGRIYREECGQQLSRGRDVLQINSVPTFVIDNRLGIPGLVPKSSLVAVFREQLADGDISR
jgi:predicted DsbA family dithiol-disulfide isomerase